MKSINFDELEVGLLERYLDKLKDYMIKDESKWNNNEYDFEKINTLLERVRKNNFRPIYRVQKREYRDTLRPMREGEEE